METLRSSVDDVVRDLRRVPNDSIVYIFDDAVSRMQLESGSERYDQIMITRIGKIVVGIGVFQLSSLIYRPAIHYYQSIELLSEFGVVSDAGTMTTLYMANNVEQFLITVLIAAAYVALGIYIQRANNKARLIWIWGAAPISFFGYTVAVAMYFYLLSNKAPIPIYLHAGTSIIIAIAFFTFWSAMYLAKSDIRNQFTNASGLN